MQFSKIISFFLAFFSFGAFALATPTPAVEKRVSDASVIDAFATLSATLAPIFVQIDAAVSAKVVTVAILTPLVADINAALDVNAAALVLLEKRDVEKRQSDDAVISALATIVADIAVKLDAVVVLDPSLVSIAALVDVHLAPVIVNVNVLIPGVLALNLDLFAAVTVDITALLWVKVLALLVI